MSAFLERVRREPVLVATLVGSVLALLVAFGVNLSDLQIAAILAVVNAGLAFVVRRRVTPTP
ncbi:hypothetical protein ACJ5H2_13640 [Nocardioides sp. R1-1]|uniref:hypothetical protein n=1 Tax=Nocardioides sp. R1-1 TaxID=3383502 RepID=UPI0038D0C0A0